MLSEHFSEEEFACHHCGQLPEQGISPALLNGLERLRALFKLPIHVTSGYRCPCHNAAVGGVSNSQHVLATAADIYIDGVPVRDLASSCRKIFDGVGVYEDDGFVHVDMREGGYATGVYNWEG